MKIKKEEIPVAMEAPARRGIGSYRKKDGGIQQVNFFFPFAAMFLDTSYDVTSASVILFLVSVKASTIMVRAAAFHGVVPCVAIRSSFGSMWIIQKPEG